MPRDWSRPAWFRDRPAAPAHAGRRPLEPHAADQRASRARYFTSSMLISRQSPGRGGFRLPAPRTPRVPHVAGSTRCGGKGLLRPHATFGGPVRQDRRRSSSCRRSCRECYQPASHPDPGAEGSTITTWIDGTQALTGNLHRDPQQGHDCSPVGHQWRGRSRHLRQPGRARPRRHRPVGRQLSRSRPTPRSRRRRWSAASSSWNGNWGAVSSTRSERSYATTST